MGMLSPGWVTDLAILELTGSTIEHHGDHVVLRSPANPTYHWGNCLLVLDGSAVDDAARWVRVFQDEFPGAGWVAIGLARMPDDVDAWAALGIDLELDEALTALDMPRQTTCPDGYAVHRLVTDDDWEQTVARELADNAVSGVHDPVGHEVFARGMASTRRDLSERGLAAFFGAFHGDVLVADLGIVRCGRIARYQAVGTDPDHRRRGLAAHLLGVAARWAADQGCEQWVIVTGATNPAGRVYRAAGFAPAAGSAQAYRPREAVQAPNPPDPALKADPGQGG